MSEPFKPSVQISTTDGYVFAIIAHVKRALMLSGQRERAEEWTTRARRCESYDAVFQLMFDYVEPK